MKYARKKAYGLKFMLRKQSIFREYPDSLFNDVRYFVLFLGHDRSGHSIVRAVLDAQPGIVISNEIGAHRLMQKYRFNTPPVFKLILQNSKDRTEMKYKEYQYNIQGQHQGRFRKIEVIGDKMAERTTRQLSADTRLTKRLMVHFGDSLKIINVVRNPYDNISSIAIRRGLSISRATDEFFLVARQVERLKKMLKTYQWHTVFHEDLIDDKAGEIVRMCAFLGQTVSPGSLAACSSAIYDSPNKRRHNVDWSERDKRRVQDKMRQFPSMARYSF